MFEPFTIHIEASFPNIFTGLSSNSKEFRTFGDAGRTPAQSNDEDDLAETKHCRLHREKVEHCVKGELVIVSMEMKALLKHKMPLE